MGDARELSLAARRIFKEALKRVDAGKAVHNAVRIEGSALRICDEPSGIGRSDSLSVVAIGKAAYPMAAAFDRVAGKHIGAGVVSGVKPGADPCIGPNWREFCGGHPLPNVESLEAARACLDLLERAGAERSPIVFLISGGGSAMMEMPRDPRITLADLRELNRVLITSGAAIAEINSIRRAVSAVKGGGLALRASGSKQISLIVSDTMVGDAASVASGPSILPGGNVPDPLEVIGKYGLRSSIPLSVERFLEEGYTRPAADLAHSQHHVLLDNREAVDCTVEVAESIGFLTGRDLAEHDEMIEGGVAGFLDRALAFKRSAPAGRPVCFISGGEFGCVVKGPGIGGRNCETALRTGLLAEKDAELRDFAFLSAGTDGIDGNSPAAGSVIDNITLPAARSRGIDPLQYLENSDSFTFLREAGATIDTGPTGTNVRDLRIFLAA